MCSDASDSGAGSINFQTTHWSLVLSAREKGSQHSTEALAALCRTYWSPIYSFLRRDGHAAHAAEDLTQKFFGKLLEPNFLHNANQGRGRFRAYLLGALKHFLANERKAANAKKRGGGKAVLSLDFSSAEAAYQLEPADQRTPQRLFEQRWALLVLDRVLQRLEAENAASGKGEQFSHLAPFLTAGEAPVYREVAAKLQTTEAAVKMAVHRLKRRYRALLREEIGQTVADPTEVDAELYELFAVLSAR
jgi:RNA polymerase sigma-70 factor (ECF subfamily)